ncbi:hypothetical protein, partial [Aggregatibacter segnis]|uniref:hypothetical protein n=1 Tax=Aggregatibacter segnis TaxID=739 RepID=UPI0028EFBA67
MSVAKVQSDFFMFLTENLPKMIALYHDNAPKIPLFSKEGLGEICPPLRLHVFNPTLHLFLFPRIKRTGIRAAEVA